MAMRWALLVSPSLLVCQLARAQNWYDGIDGLMVFSPDDDVQSAVDNIFNEMSNAQFSDKRYAVLLRSGNYGNLQMQVGFYTNILGVGVNRWAVTAASFYTLDDTQAGPGVGACQNFWRSVEGLTVTNPSITWAASQAAPLRRIEVQGDLWLSIPGPPHWSSGGFLGDVLVLGHVHVGTQQQYAFRNCQFNNGIDTTTGGWNFVFVGVTGAPTSSPTDKTGQVSSVDQTPQVAEKPFLVEDNGNWYIQVPHLKSDSHGIAVNDSAGTRIPMADVFVARPQHTAAEINAGMASKRALLLPPGIYGLEEPLRVASDGFVVLGLGFATLVPAPGLTALWVEASDVRVASILVEASGEGGAEPTGPLVLWTGAGGVLTDIFTRAGSFSYQGPFHASCGITKADVHVQIDGDGVIVDNTWLWHADHDDCGKKSDQCYSGNGLLVHGRDVTAYGLKVEHMMSNLVEWHGEGGRVYFYQSELPYDDSTFGQQGFVGYKVDYSIQSHAAVGLGVYIVGGLQVPTAFRLPAGAAVRNLVIWCITGSASQFGSVVCTSHGTGDCQQGDQCLGSACYLTSLPPVRASGTSAAVLVV